jgi:transposase-like protein
MRYPAAEKLEIIRLVEQSSLSVRRTLAQLGIPRSTFYCWYDRYRARHDEALERTTTCRASSNSAWPSSSTTTTCGVITKASTT